MKLNAPKAVLAAFTVTLAINLLLLPSGLRGADSAEFATLMVAPGVAHPPGYPLYTMILRAFAWLPLEAATAAAIVTATLGAAASACVAMMSLRLGAQPRGALLVAVALATEFHVLAVTSHPEVFALNNLLAAAILAVGVRPLKNPDIGVGVLGLLAGLGLANHHSIVLLTPFGLWAVWQNLGAAKSPAKALTSGVTGLIVGLMPYAILYATWDACSSCLSWGSNRDGLPGLWDHVTRTAYGSTSLAVSGSATAGEQWATWGKSLATRGLLVIPIIAAIGVVRGWRSNRALATATTLSIILAGPVFIALFNTDITPIGEAIVSRFYALPIVLCAPLIALAVRGMALPRHLALGFLLLIPLVPATRELNLRDGTTIDDYITDTLTPLPRDAVVFSTGDQRYFGAAYMQWARGVRPDVTWIDGKLLAYPWYHDRVEGRLELTLPRSTASSIPIVDVVAEVIGSGRPVFITHPFADGLTQFPSYPIGTAIRLLAPDERPPSPAQLAAQNARLLNAMKFDPTQPVHDVWAVDLVASYARPWEALATAFERMGDQQGAKHAADLATSLRRPITPSL